MESQSGRSKKDWSNCVCLFGSSEYISTVRYNPGNTRNICFRSRHSHTFPLGFPFLFRIIIKSIIRKKKQKEKKNNPSAKTSTTNISCPPQDVQAPVALSALVLSPCILTFERSFLGCRSRSGQARDHSCQHESTHRYTKATKRLPDTAVNVCGASTQSNTLECDLNCPHVAPSVPWWWKHPMDVCSNLRICIPARNTRPVATIDMFSQLVHKATPPHTARLLGHLVQVQLFAVLVAANTTTGHLIWAHPKIRTASSQFCE